MVSFIERLEQRAIVREERRFERDLQKAEKLKGRRERLEKIISLRSARKKGLEEERRKIKELKSSLPEGTAAGVGKALTSTFGEAFGEAFRGGIRELKSLRQKKPSKAKSKKIIRRKQNRFRKVKSTFFVNGQKITTVKRVRIKPQKRVRKQLRQKQQQRQPQGSFNIFSQTRSSPTKKKKTNRDNIFGGLGIWIHLH